MLEFGHIYSIIDIHHSETYKTKTFSNFRS